MWTNKSVIDQLSAKRNIAIFTTIHLEVTVVTHNLNTQSDTWYDQSDTWYHQAANTWYHQSDMCHYYFDMWYYLFDTWYHQSDTWIQQADTWIHQSDSDITSLLCFCRPTQDHTSSSLHLVICRRKTSDSVMCCIYSHEGLHRGWNNSYNNVIIYIYLIIIFIAICGLRAYYIISACTSGHITYIHINKDIYRCISKSHNCGCTQVHGYFNV